MTFLVRAHSACPACHDHNVRPVTHKDGKTGKPLAVVCCATCGLGRIDPLPTEEILSHWYKNEYREEYKQSESPSRRHVLRAARLAVERFDWLRTKLPTGGVSHVLDIGASSGEFLHLARTLDMNAIGIEPHIGYARHAESTLGLRVLAGTLQDNIHHIEHCRFDLITMFHVLEHLVDPIATLKTLRGLLADGGILYVEVPNAGRLSAPNNMFFRAHTLYFTCHTIREVCAAAGLEIAADNFDDPGNVVVALRRTSLPKAPRWTYDDALLVTQARRRWLPYLWNSFITGRLQRRLSIRREEKQAAASYTSDQSLLAHIHGAYKRACGLTTSHAKDSD